MGSALREVAFEQVNKEFGEDEEDATYEDATYEDATNIHDHEEYQEDGLATFGSSQKSNGREKGAIYRPTGPSAEERKWGEELYQWTGQLQTFSSGVSNALRDVAFEPVDGLAEGLAESERKSTRSLKEQPCEVVEEGDGEWARGPGSSIARDEKLSLSYGNGVNETTTVEEWGEKKGYGLGSEEEENVHLKETKRKDSAVPIDGSFVLPPTWNNGCETVWHDNDNRQKDDCDVQLYQQGANDKSSGSEAISNGFQERKEEESGTELLENVRMEESMEELTLSDEEVEEVLGIEKKERWDKVDTLDDDDRREGEDDLILDAGEGMGNEALWREKEKRYRDTIMQLRQQMEEALQQKEWREQDLLREMDERKGGEKMREQRRMKEREKEREKEAEWKEKIGVAEEMAREWENECSIMEDKLDEALKEKARAIKSRDVVEELRQELEVGNNDDSVAVADARGGEGGGSRGEGGGEEEEAVVLQ